MKKPKKPNYSKWTGKSRWLWWQFICLMADIDPPKDFTDYLKLKGFYKPLKDKEEEFRKKGFFKDFNIPDPEKFN
jgi:hypothetical protein